MKALEIYPSEIRTYQDRISGVTVKQMTRFRGHSFHTYFTNNGFWDQNRRLLFTSDRKNACNLFSIELESGEISRLTDFSAGDWTPTEFVNDVNPKRPEIYYIRENKLYAFDLMTLESRFLYQAPEGFELHGGLVGADGRYAYVTLMEDLSNRIYTNLSASYVGMRDVFHAKPDCRIVRVDVDTAKADELWQEYCWIGHVNPSPTQPTIVTFCHEGPWQLVDQRIWVMDTQTCKPVMLRPRKMPGEMVGHEYWYKDGLRVGYQAHKPEMGSYFGVINYDGTEEHEAPCVPFPSPDHVHSIDYNLIVSDSGKSVKLYRYNGTDFDDARVLCMHDGSFFHQFHHPHPKITDDGKQVLYNSNVDGYSNLYMVDIPADVAALPKVKDL